MNAGAGDVLDRIEAYIASAPDAQREGLERLREVIRAAAPGAVEGFGYGMPGFKYRGRPLAYIGAAKNHYALYGPIGGAMESFGDELRGYDTSKGTLRFKAGEPPPEALVTKIVRARMQEIDAAEAARKERNRGSR